MTFLSLGMSAMIDNPFFGKTVRTNLTSCNDFTVVNTRKSGSVKQVQDDMFKKVIFSLFDNGSIAPGGKSTSDILKLSREGIAASETT
jgi:hypothetical protein